MQRVMMRGGYLSLATALLYTATAASAGVVGGSEIRIVLNGLDVALRYVVIIDR